MRYAALIYSAEGADPAPETPEGQAHMNAYFVFTDELAASGKLLGGEPLEGVETATTVQVRDGERIVTDGPFAETKEILGGFYLFEADDLDDAIDIAAKIPTAQYGSIEVRPLMELPSR